MKQRLKKKSIENVEIIEQKKKRLKPGGIVNNCLYDFLFLT